MSSPGLQFRFLFDINNNFIYKTAFKNLDAVFLLEFEFIRNTVKTTISKIICTV